MEHLRQQKASTPQYQVASVHHVSRDASKKTALMHCRVVHEDHFYQGLGAAEHAADARQHHHHHQRQNRLGLLALAKAEMEISGDSTVPKITASNK